MFEFPGFGFIPFFDVASIGLDLHQPAFVEEPLEFIGKFLFVEEGVVFVVLLIVDKEFVKEGGIEEIEGFFEGVEVFGIRGAIPIAFKI